MNTIIATQPIADDDWQLVDNDNRPVYAGEIVVDFRGDKAVIVGGRSPHKPSSTGFVYVRWMNDEGLSGEREYYPSVFGLTWGSSCYRP